MLAPIFRHLRDASSYSQSFCRCVSGSGLPRHLNHSDPSSPSLYEFAWFARQAYSNESELQAPPTARKQTWTFKRERSHCRSKAGVYLQTWEDRRGNAVIAIRGTTFDEVAHFIGNMALLSQHENLNLPLEQWLDMLHHWGLLEDKGFVGADDTKDIVKSLIEKYSHDGTRIWLVGHSRGAALAESAALDCSDALAGIISFESPGVPEKMKQQYTIEFPERFVSYYTYPNFINLLHPAVTNEHRYHIPTRISSEASTWDFVTACLVSDANRLFNYSCMAIPMLGAAGSAAKTAGSMAKAKEFVELSKFLTSIASGSALLVKGAQAMNMCRLGQAVHFAGKMQSLKLGLEDVQMCHSMDGIVKHLSYSSNTSEIRKVSSWPSDFPERLQSEDVLKHFLLELARNEVLFNQPDLPGIHQLAEAAGKQRMFEARMQRLWAGHWELEALGRAAPNLST